MSDPRAEAISRLLGSSPARVRSIDLPRRLAYFPSPGDWRDEVLYFLLPDRFSDGQEASRPLLDRADLPAARPADGGGWRWDAWARSGADRFQGGTIAGIASKLDYLKRLGVTALWVAPVFKQRRHLDTYHGYGIQDFLEVDPRFGTREDLVALVHEAHARGMRVILDVIFNHTGDNWLYAEGVPGGRYQPHYTGGRHPFGGWRNADGDDAHLLASLAGTTRDDGVYPEELQDPECYTRAGAGNLGAGHPDDPHAEHKRSDFLDLRDIGVAHPRVLNDVARCYKYWIALTDCDGFRIDTLKHVSFEEARNFCGSIREFAANLGKADFFLVGEIAGGDFVADRYLDVLDRNLNAALDIGEMRLTLNLLAKGLVHPDAYFDGFDPGRAILGSHRNLGRRHVSILDDHDHVFGEKVRFASESATTHQAVAGVAIQLFTLGIPCIYYGTEQALGGPEPAERVWLPEWKRSDRYLRETMFGPRHARLPGGTGTDTTLPGFGAFGTAGRHVFDESAGAYRRIAALAAVRKAFPALRSGRQYLRPTSFLGRPFAVHGPGELLAWSRLLDEDEALVVVNVHGTATRGADVVVDASLNGDAGSRFTIVASSAEAAGLPTSNRTGTTLPVQRTGDGPAFVAVRDVGPSEVLVLANRP